MQLERLPIDKIVTTVSIFVTQMSFLRAANIESTQVEGQWSVITPDPDARSGSFNQMIRHTSQSASTTGPAGGTIIQVHTFDLGWVPLSRVWYEPRT